MTLRFGISRDKEYLFHKEVWIPDELAKPCYVGPLRYARHAQEAADNEGYGRIPLPRSISPSDATLIEVGFNPRVEANGGVTKQVWRKHLDSDRDLVIVITPEGFVKTVWVNLTTDKHSTLNKARYVTRARRD